MAWYMSARGLFAHMRRHGFRGSFIMRGCAPWVVGMPDIWQARDADNDNRAPR